MKIAAAIAFSPRMQTILSEASRLSQLFNAELILIHIGMKDEHKKKLLQDEIGKVKELMSYWLWQLPVGTLTYWIECFPMTWSILRVQAD